MWAAAPGERRQQDSWKGQLERPSSGRRARLLPQNAGATHHTSTTAPPTPHPPTWARYLTAAFAKLVSRGGAPGKAVGIEHIPELQRQAEQNIGRDEALAQMMRQGEARSGRGGGHAFSQISLDGRRRAVPVAAVSVHWGGGGAPPLPPLPLQATWRWWWAMGARGTPPRRRTMPSTWGQLRRGCRRSWWSSWLRAGAWWCLWAPRAACRRAGDEGWGRCRRHSACSAHRCCRRASRQCPLRVMLTSAAPVSLCSRWRLWTRARMGACVAAMP